MLSMDMGLLVALVAGSCYCIVLIQNPCHLHLPACMRPHGSKYPNRENFGFLHQLGPSNDSILFRTWTLLVDAGSFVR